MRRIAIDTNIYTSFKCNDQKVVEAFRDCDLIGVDITVIAELLSGFSLGGKEKRNRQEMEAFLNSPRVEATAGTLFIFYTFPFEVLLSLFCRFLV
jgi:predicted nucleic acid-binding protein